MLKTTTCHFETKLGGERKKEGEKKTENIQAGCYEIKKKKGKEKMEPWTDILSQC